MVPWSLTDSCYLISPAGFLQKLYESYERQGLARKVIKAQKLWYAILESQTETGTPYMLYKDACNSKSNQQNLGTIRCSNLCTEVIEYSSPEEVAVCNLASIALPSFVVNRESYDFEKLHSVCNVHQVSDEFGRFRVNEESGCRSRI